MIRGIVTLTNNTDQPIRRTQVECSFDWSKGRRTVAVSTLYFYDLPARNSLSQELVAFAPRTDFIDSGSCRTIPN
jgi:hypothetical protein